MPPVVVRVDASVQGPLAHPRGRPLVARIGTSFRTLSPRPLPYGQFADPVFLLDYTAALRWSVVEIAVDVLNVTNRRWAATELVYVSQWDPSAVPSRIPARHIMAGAPLTVLFTLGLHLGAKS